MFPFKISLFDYPLSRAVIWNLKLFRDYQSAFSPSCSTASFLVIFCVKVLHWFCLSLFSCNWVLSVFLFGFLRWFFICWLKLLMYGGLRKMVLIWNGGLVDEKGRWYLILWFFPVEFWYCIWWMRFVKEKFQQFCWNSDGHVDLHQFVKFCNLFNPYSQSLQCSSISNLFRKF